MATSRTDTSQRNPRRTASALNAYIPGEHGEPEDLNNSQGTDGASADIANRDDILLLVSTFYTRAFADPLIGPIFTDVVHMDLVRHMPIMADFWQTVLFKAGLYSRNALKIHFDIHAQEPLTLEHFNRWLQLWTNTVDALFSGDKAEMAKVQAHLIAGSLHRRVTGRPASQYSTISMRPPEL
ncbi:group III truncated hemoglobin [Arthrobacter cryoconiti]|uniref:Group III truncated hemoglobin n=1 Tax=Arthrobacter cryoconiti TaxID=748907 RepID=A0ABV8QVP1_9MICC|nr:group III truncated hemoglobin [Arthrobacter cryoconiti]MCC9068972.1 group III truncated hemoglobin [Arthrobacter cryoconiti]